MNSYRHRNCGGTAMVDVLCTLRYVLTGIDENETYDYELETERTIDVVGSSCICNECDASVGFDDLEEVKE